MTIILLKNQQNNDPYAALPDKTIFVPLMEHEFINQDKLLECLESLEFEQVDCVIVTSQRAVEAISEQLSKLSEVAQISVLSKPVYTVGPATAALLRFKGFTDVRGEDSGNGAVLSEELKTLGFKNYIFFTGEVRRDAIPDTLNSMEGVALEERVVYKTIELKDTRDRFVKAMNNSDKNPAIVFFSPSCADEVVKELTQNHDRNSYKLAAIGPTTEEYLQSHNLTPDAVAEKPDPIHLHKSLFRI